MEVFNVPSMDDGSFHVVMLMFSEMDDGSFHVVVLMFHEMDNGSFHVVRWTC